MEQTMETRREEKMLVLEWLSKKQRQELSRLRLKLAKRLRRHVRSLAEAQVDERIATVYATPGEAVRQTDKDARRALVSATCDEIALYLARDWLAEIERCFIRNRRMDPQFFLHPWNLDGAMLPVRTISKEWFVSNGRTPDSLMSQDDARRALESLRSELARSGPPFPPEAYRHFEILGCFVSRVKG